MGLVIGLLPCLPAQAEQGLGPEMWQLCKPLDVVPLPADDGKDGSKAPLHISADKASTNQNKDLNLQGDVRIRQGQRLLLADHVDYSQANDTFKADGNVILRNKTLQINSHKAEVNLKTQQGIYDHTHYQYLPRHASGDAARMSSSDGDHQKLEQVTYTTCDPDHVVWQLKANDIELDQSKNQGYAHDIALYFKKLPIFYFPYLRFPIGNQRMSGFLFPAFTTIDNNTKTSIPYYWNMAPNYDMTITPSIFTNRGVMLEDQFRYLTERSHGNLDVEYLPNDQLTGTNRGRLSFTHDGAFASHWHTNAQLNYVSELSYFTDVDQNYELSLNPYLRNSLQTSYSGSVWNFSGGVEAYQVLSNNDKNVYQRMPQLSLGLKPAGNNHLNTLFNTEYNNFYSADITQNPTIGSRLDTTVGFSYPYRSTATFLTPTLSWRDTQYQLLDRSTDTTSAPSRDLPMFSLDGGVYLERSLLNNSVIQTLEPRLYYLYVPYVDQSNLPVFDTSSYTFDFNQFFRDNRFIGADRIGDANQLTTAVTTRFLSADSGRELFSLSLGQIHYYADRKVNLDSPTTTTPTPPQTAGSSDYIAQLGARLSSSWNLTSNLVWDPANNTATTSNNQLQYKSDRGHIFNFGYTLTPNTDGTTDVQTISSALWQLTPSWQVYGHQTYDILNQKPLDTIVGFGYESCCWGLRLTHRSYRSKPTTTPTDLYTLQFEFKGLASVGTDTDAMLKSGILGYEPEPR